MVVLLAQLRCSWHENGRKRGGTTIVHPTFAAETVLEPINAKFAMYGTCGISYTYGWIVK